MRPGTYTIWYENEQSIKHKLSLIKKYDLKGTGSWSLGQETSSVWNYYSLWLNGHYYSDCQGHWALNSIIYALNNEWISVKGSSDFAPDKPLTRAETAVALVRAFQLGKDVIYIKDKVAFSDISSHWARKEIEIAVQHRIVMGKGDGSFAPDEAVTREEMSVMLDRVLTENRVLAGSSSRSENHDLETDSANSADYSVDSIDYIDVDRETCAWSYDSIVRMIQQGVFAGSPDGKFKPKEKTSRAEMAELLYRIWKDH